MLPLILALLLAAKPALPRSSTNGRYSATAYSIAGQTASGDPTHRGRVAADPRFLPLGSRIQITGAGIYSGEYVVGDTGPKVRGRRLDLFIPNRREARRFGRRMVHVRVIATGRRD